MFRRHHAIAAIVAMISWSSEIDIGPQNHVFLRPIQAQANPCATPQGYMIFCCPKPCPVTDFSKIGVNVQQLSSEISKLNSQVDQYRQWLASLMAIGSQATGLISKFLSIPGSITGTIKGLAQVPSINIPSMMSGTNLSDITSIKNSLSSVFGSGGSNPATMAARQLLMQDSSALASAAGMNGRSVQSDTLTDANKLLTSVQSATNTREDLAARNAVTLALLQSLQTTNTLTSIFNQLQGVSSLFQAGDNSTGSQSVSITYATPTAAPQIQTGQSLSQVAAAITAIQNAIDMHNALVASNEMQQASQFTQTVSTDYQQKQAVAQQALQNLTTSLAPFYVDPAAAATAMNSAAAPSITAPWPEVYPRVAQEQGAAQTISEIAIQAPTTYGAYQCVDGGMIPTCSEQLSQAIVTNLSTLLDANNQVNWYSQFGVDAATTQQTIQGELQSLSTAYGVDFTDPTAVQSAINIAIQSAQTNISAAQADPTITQSSISQITAIQTALQTLSSDPNFQYYLPYDATIGTAPNSQTAASQISP